MTSKKSQTTTLCGFDPEDASRVELTVEMIADGISIKDPATSREILIELSEGSLMVRAYAADREEPLSLRLPETGTVEVERGDYDSAEPPVLNPDTTLVILKGDEPDDRLFWSNEQGWVDLANATRFALEEKDRLDLPMGGAWVHECEWLDGENDSPEP